ncbi:MAG: ABC transporter ATP-binding protein [Pseudomonadota bacterium]
MPEAAPAASAPILSVQNLSMAFPVRKGLFGRASAAVTAVDNVSFDVFSGETFGIVGESGCGKTTTGRCILRILDPTEGTITYRSDALGEVDLAELGRDELRTVWREMRMIFQDPQSSLNPRLPIIEIIGQSLRASGMASGREVGERVKELLADVGMRPEILHRYPGAFSGGQRQRIGIARALATKPKVVIADEAVSALDVSIQAQTLNLLADLQERYGLTYIFIAHDLAVVEHVCDRVAVMYLGQVVELSDKRELFAAPKHPYTRTLLSAVPVADPRQRRTRARSIPEGEADTGSVTTACKFAPRCPHAKEICSITAPPAREIGGAKVVCHFAGEI